MTKRKPKAHSRAEPAPKPEQANEKQNPWNQRVALIGGIAAASVAVAGLITTAAGPVSAYIAGLPPQMAAKYDKTSPLTTKCVEDNEEWKTFRSPQSDSEVNPATIMRINGSPSCKTAWVYVANSIDGTRVDKTIERAEGDGASGVRSSTPNDLTINPLIEVNGKKTIGDNGKSYTDQVYAPRCVWVSLTLSNVKTGKMLWNVPRQEVCKQ